jgi:hypothetical protein
VAVFGTPSQARDGLDRFRGAGVDLPVVEPKRGASRERLEQVVEAFAPR